MPRKAVTNDGVWALAQAAALAVLIATDRLTAATAMSAWGFGALAGALAGMAQFRLWPTPGRDMRSWIRRHAALGRWMALASGIYSVGSYTVLILLGSLGRRAIGGMRSTMNLFAPAQLVAISGESIMLPTAVRMVNNEESGRLQTICVLYSLGLASCFAVAGGALLLAGPVVFRLVFGSQFTRFVTLVPPVLAQTVAAGLTSGASVGMRALANGRKVAGLQVFASSSRVILVAAVLPFGLTATAWAIAVADMASAGLAWVLFRSALKNPRRIEAIVAPSISMDDGHGHLADWAAPSSEE
jgi:hypothetical protein